MTRRHQTSRLQAVILLLAVLVFAGCAAESGKINDDAFSAGSKNRVRLEHVAINVEDPVAMARWYKDNLDMKIVREGPPPANMRFISDSGGNMMLELYNNPPDEVPDYPAMNPLSLHIAFMVDDVKAITRKLIGAGATIAVEMNTTPAGDELIILRDPWGIPIQFLKRAKPMLPHK